MRRWQNCAYGYNYGYNQTTTRIRRRRLLRQLQPATTTDATTADVRQMRSYDSATITPCGAATPADTHAARIEKYSQHVLEIGDPADALSVESWKTVPGGCAYAPIDVCTSYKRS